jgi:hypothetical protein
MVITTSASDPALTYAYSEEQNDTPVVLLRPACRELDSLAVNHKTLEHVFSFDVMAEIPSRSVSSGTYEPVCFSAAEPRQYANHFA